MARAWPAPVSRVWGLCLALIVFVVTDPASAAGPQQDDFLHLVVEPGAIQVHFAVGAVFHTVRGTARAHSAAMSMNTETGEMLGQVAVAAGSLATGLAWRDHRMHEQVLRTEEHPDIQLQLISAEGTLDLQRGGTLQVEGTLHLAGTVNPLSFPVELRITDPGEREVHFQGGFHVPYVRWGLRDPSAVLLRVDKEVRVTFAGRGRLVPGPATHGR